MLRATNRFHKTVGKGLEARHPGTHSRALRNHGIGAANQPELSELSPLQISHPRVTNHFPQIMCQIQTQTRFVI